MEQMQKMQRKYWVKISFLSRREREDVRTKYNSTHYYKLSLTGLKPSKLATNRFYFSLVSRDTILNQRLISRELLPRLPSCQPGASQPCPGETGAGLRIVAWRGNYLLSRHSIYLSKATLRHSGDSSLTTVHSSRGGKKLPHPCQ